MNAVSAVLRSEATIVQDSLWDIDVVSRNVEAFRLLLHQPPAAISAIATSTLRNERETVLRHRYEQFHDVALRQFRAVPPLAANADRLATDWADRRFERDSLAVRLLLQLGKGADVGEILVIDDKAQRLLAEMKLGKRAPLFVSAHCGAYQALPAVLAALGHAPAFLMDGGAQSLATTAYAAFVPDLAARVVPVAAQQAQVGLELISHVRSGKPVLIYPEFAFHTQGYPTATFFRRTVFTPPGVETISRAARVPVVPVRVLPEGDRYRVLVDEPLWLPGQEAQRGDVTRALFLWLSRVVAADPADWWCWEIFERHMAADDQPRAERQRIDVRL